MRCTYRQRKARKEALQCAGITVAFLAGLALLAPILLMVGSVMAGLPANYYFN